MHTPSCSPAGEDGLVSPTEGDFRRLFELSLDLLCVAGIDGYFKHVNPSWTRVLGWSREELLSRPVVEFLHPDDREQTLRARAALAKGVSVRGLENRYLCKDGSYRWLAWQSSIEPTATTVFAVARDITDRRQMDHEHLVMSKLESTGILAGGIAHDFNNLLASLLLNLDMIGLCGAINDEQDRFLRSARKAVHAAGALTEQLTAFATGGETSRAVVDLKPLLQQSIDVVLAGATVVGGCVVSPDLWPVEGNETEIGQVFRSLLLNAREATPAGGSVRLHAENVVLEAVSLQDVAAGDYVRIRVVDDGIGISAEVLPKVFDPYFSTKQRGVQKGMGLGLTICRTVVQKHGGLIAIESRPNCGTTVTCHLPAARSES